MSGHGVGAVLLDGGRGGRRAARLRLHAARSARSATRPRSPATARAATGSSAGSAAYYEDGGDALRFEKPLDRAVRTVTPLTQQPAKHMQPSDIPAS